MKRYILKTISTLLVCTLTLGIATSCEDWLKEESFDFIQPDDIPDSDDGATQWVMGVYNKILEDMFSTNDFPWAWEKDCDYLTGPDWAFSYFGAGNFENESSIESFWEKFYNLIHRANYAGEIIEEMKNLTPEYKQNVLGELNFLKGWSYFNLVRAFGGVPLWKISVNNSSEQNLPRSSVKEVYDYIIECLEMAMEQMYRNTEAAYTEGRLASGAAAGLLAKVYLTMASGSMPAGTQVTVKGGVPWTGEGDNRAYTVPQSITHSKEALEGYDQFELSSQQLFAKARDYAKDVIDGKCGSYRLVDFSDLWKKERPRQEHMFVVDAVSGHKNYGLQLNYHYSGREENGLITNGLWYGGRDHWYRLFEAGDLRITEGIMHRWQRNWDLNQGQYYPDTEEMRRKVFGYTDPVTGEEIGPEPPYDDGLVYRSPQFDVYFLAFTTKYYDRTDKSLDMSDGAWPILRYADVELIYAEAAAEAAGSPTSDALAALNRVRARSNATPRNDFTDLVSFRSAVLEERAMELAFEGDRRWDLIRWGIYVGVMNAIGGYDEVGVYKERLERHKLWPIPSSEMNTNSAIDRNNPGWN